MDKQQVQWATQEILGTLLAHLGNVDNETQQSAPPQICAWPYIY